VYVDGRFDRAVTASNSRPDVGAVFPAWGSGHGFDVSIPDLWVANHQVCVYAMNVSVGSVNPLLGCLQVRPQGEPFGVVDRVARTSGGIEVAGWVIDPDTTQPVDVRVYVDGAATALLADQNRVDVANAFPSYGPLHGFLAVVPAPPGRHQVCVWGLNVAQGMSHRLLTCRELTV
jgi:hypothetical protein